MMQSHPSLPSLPPQAASPSPAYANAPEIPAIGYPVSGSQSPSYQDKTPKYPTDAPNQQGHNSLWFVKVVVRHPWRVIGVVAVVTVLLMGIVVGGGMFELAEGGDYDYSYSEHFDTKATDALKGARATVSAEEGAAPQQSEQTDAPIFLQYESKDSDSETVYTAANVVEMCKIENLIISTPGYDEYKWKPASPGASAVQSPVDAFYNADTGLAKSECATPSDAQLAQGLVLLDSIPYASASDFTSDNRKTKYARSVFFMGTPLNGYTSKDDRKDEQTEKMQEFQTDVEARFFEKFDRKLAINPIRTGYTEDFVVGDLDIKFLPVGIFELELNRMVQQDFMWAFLAVIWVWGLILFHTRSFWLSGFAMGMIMLSLPTAFFVHRVVFQVAYFDFLSILIVFLILGIGADDVFVFVDAWKQSACVPELHHSTLLRMDWAYRRASKAMFVTSSTTAVAFLATASSKITPVSSFGIWAAAVIMVNYIYVITLFPALVLVWHKYWENQSFGRCFCCKGEESHADLTLGPKDLTKTETFFKTKYAPFINGKAKVPIVVGFVVLFIVGSVFALQMTPPKEQEQWMPDYHAFQRYFARQDEFGASDVDRLVSVELVWGIEGGDNNLEKWDPNVRPGPVYDEDFASALVADPTRVLDWITATCTGFAVLPCDADGCVDGKLVDSVTRCAPQAFSDHWVTTNPNQGKWPSSTQLIPAVNAFLATAPQYKSDIGVISDKIHFISVAFESSLRQFKPYRTVRPVYDAWAEATDALNDDSDAPVKALHITPQLDWAQMWSQRAIVQNAVQGMSLCFPLAFVVMAIATLNIIVAFFGIVSIVGIVASTMGFCQTAMGWDLGTAEAIAVVILIGFSVDYTVHLGEMYLDAPGKTRQERVTHAVTYMGSTIIAGAVTTLGAGVVLWGCQLIFFTKFATILCITILFSVMWSLGFFMAAMALIGPNNEVGSLKPYVRKMQSMFQERFMDKPTQAKAAANEVAMQEIRVVSSGSGNAADAAVVYVQGRGSPQPIAYGQA